MRILVTFFRSVAGPTHRHVRQPGSFTLAGPPGEPAPRIIGANLYNPPATPPELRNRRVRLELDSLGGYAEYTLTLHGPDIDPFANRRTLRFHLDEDQAFDCRPAAVAPLPEPSLVHVDYLAKDYASFRQALMDFIPTRLAEWTERSEADIGVMLLELFAATADELSYMQDRVANEAFLGAATQRRSVADHLALFGYVLDDGGAAQTWLQFQVPEGEPLTIPASPGLRVSNQPAGDGTDVIVFETVAAATLRAEHNEMRLYAEDNVDCSLERTALSVAVLGQHEFLHVGDALLFDDILGHRDIVRLTAEPWSTSVGRAGPEGAHDVTIVQWSAATPLHFDYPASTTVLRANLVPATHGETVAREIVRPAARPAPMLPTELSMPASVSMQHLRLQLDQAPLAPQTLQLYVGGTQWLERPTLLLSGPDEKVFRVEVDEAGGATIAFGDGVRGAVPDAGALVTATYRVGGGKAGNLEADTLIKLWPRVGEEAAIALIDQVSNPMPAIGGRDPESSNHARQLGPGSARQTLVVVTDADIESAAQGFLDSHGNQPIRRARAESRWTGSWLRTTLMAEPVAGDLTEALRLKLQEFLDTERLVGSEIIVVGPVFVAIDLTVQFQMLPGYRDEDVQQRLRRVLGSAELSGGRRSFFHPANFSFGDPVFVSALYEAALSVAGVNSVSITRLARHGSPTSDAETKANLARGYLAVGADQIVRLADDRAAPQDGTLLVLREDTRA